MLGFVFILDFLHTYFPLCINTLFQNDRISAELMDFKWYLLPLKEQKSYMLMVDASNRARQLVVAKVVPLNVNLFLIVNNLYTSHLHGE